MGGKESNGNQAERDQREVWREGSSQKATLARLRRRSLAALFSRGAIVGGAAAADEGGREGCSATARDDGRDVDGVALPGRVGPVLERKEDGGGACVADEAATAPDLGSVDVDGRSALARENDPAAADVGLSGGRAGGAGVAVAVPAAGRRSASRSALKAIMLDRRSAARFCRGAMSGADVVDRTWIDWRRLWPGTLAKISSLVFLVRSGA